MSRSAKPNALRARDFAAKLSMRVLSRMWQMLLKGITEAQAATRPAAAAEMVLVRIAYVADMPTPDEAIRMIEQNGGAVAGTCRKRSATQRAGADDVRFAGIFRRHRSRRGRSLRRAPAPRPPHAPQMIAPAAGGAVRSRRCGSRAFRNWSRSPAEKRDLMTKAALEADVRLVRIEDGRLEVALERHACAQP